MIYTLIKITIMENKIIMKNTNIFFSLEETLTMFQNRKSKIEVVSVQSNQSATFAFWIEMTSYMGWKFNKKFSLELITVDWSLLKS